MKRWPLAVLMAGLLMVPGGAAVAQAEAESEYLDEDYGVEERRWALGISIGLVELGDNFVEGQRVISDDDVEPYFGLSLRIPFGDRDANYGVPRGGFQGYLEPELGYWESDFSSDALLGLNLVGSMPINAVEFYLGGGIAVHFIDREIGIAGVQDDSDTALGLNAHFGLDISVSENVSFFGVGRFDLVDGDRDELEGKASVGIRLRL